MIPLTPEPGHDCGGIAAEVIARCAELGILAVFFDGLGGVMGRTPEPLRPEALLRTDAVLPSVASLLNRTPQAEGALPSVQVAGLGRLFVAAVDEAGGLVGRLVVLLPERGGVERSLLAAWSEACGVASNDLARGVGSVADASMLRVVEASVRSMIADSSALRGARDALSGFTSHLSDSYETIEVVYALGRAMRGPFEPNAFLGAVCDRLHGAMKFRWIAAVFGEDAGPRAMRGRFTCTGTPPVSRETMHDAALSLAATAGRSSGVQIHTDAGLFCSRESPQVVVMPLLCMGKVAGVLLAGGKAGEDAAVSSYDTQLIEAAGSFTNAFADNVALYEEQRDLFIGTVRSLTAAIDAKDRYTFGHSERVSFLATDLARLLGLSESEIETTRIAGLIHDVGKIGVPEAVLTKPGRLTEDEFALIRLHPETGHRILRGIPQLASVLPGVLHHHEHYNGKGYPHGLEGESIPLLARIIAVADTFDAMSSNRSYRAALARERVLDEIERCGGTQFDPRISAMIRRIDLAGFDAMVARHASDLSTARAA